MCAFFRAQARHLLHRVQGICTAEAAASGAPQCGSLQQASRSCSSVAAADGTAGTWQQSDAGSCSMWPLEQPSRQAVVLPTAGTGLLWTLGGIHSLRPAITAALLQPSPGGRSGSLGLVHLLQPAPDISPDWREEDVHEVSSEGQPAVMELVKREYQPSVIIRKRRHGFLSRLRSKGGQRVLERRKLKGRWKKSA